MQDFASSKIVTGQMQQGAIMRIKLSLTSVNLSLSEGRAHAHMLLPSGQDEAGVHVLTMRTSSFSGHDNIDTLERPPLPTFGDMR